MALHNSAITITWGDQAENHANMQKIGKMADCGFSMLDLRLAMKRFEEVHCECQLVQLDLKVDGLMKTEMKDAGVLIVRNGINTILQNVSDHKYDRDGMYNELLGLEWDKKAKMYGRVVNKKARWNLCFDEQPQEPDYVEGRGRVVAYDAIPITNAVRNRLHLYITSVDSSTIVGEGNYYYDTSKCYIGYHGDSERRKVVAVRLGGDLPLHYQWFHHGKTVGERYTIDLHHGDLYIMSEKAVGTDWKKPNIYSLRHAAGINLPTAVCTKKRKISTI